MSAVGFIPLGNNQLLALDASGLPYGVQNDAGITVFGASLVDSVVGTTNEITVATVSNVVTLTIPVTFIAPGSIQSTTTIVAGTSLAAGTTVTAGTMFKNHSYVKASLPAAAGNAGATIYVSDATGAHVTGSLCFSNGTSWIDVTTGIAVA